MTEQEWLTSNDPAAMLLQHLQCWPTGSPHPDNPRYPSDRKLRLFAVACCRAVWDRLTDDRSRRAVEVAERFADGRATEAELEVAERESNMVRLEAFTDLRERDAAYAAWCSAHPSNTLVQRARIHAHDASGGERIEGGGENYLSPVQAALLRCIFGNPWRPVDFLLRCQRTGNPVGTDTRPIGIPCGCHSCSVFAVAQHIYDSRDFALMPQLGDALEEAGCEDWWLLAHCRGEEICPACLCGPKRKVCRTLPGGNPNCFEGSIPFRGPHARGCWVIDLILGKE